MRADRLAVAAALALLVAVAGCGGSEAPPLRIGVVTDCTGVYRALNDAELSGATLPLIERGAELLGRGAADGVGAARVAGRRVQLVPGCTESLEFAAQIAELRRLVESEHVDVVIAAATGADEVVLREVARRHPRTPFVVVAHGPRELTLRRPAANVFRFVADHGQGVAGLAEHAYRDLGWRRVAIVLGAWDAGWGARDAFAAGFCRLGGRIAKEVQVPVFDPAGRDVRGVPRDVDGVAVFASPFFGPQAFLRRLARRVGDPAQRIVLGPGIMDAPALLSAAGPGLDGVTGSSTVAAARLAAYLRAFGRAFPGIDPDVAATEPVSGYADAMEAVLRGVELAGGDPARLAGALGRVRPDLLGGPVRLDAHRQAVVSTAIARVTGGGSRRLVELSRASGVDQSVGGLLEPDLEPSDAPARCR